ncbi:cardiac-enriched FHL2-interacting protein [Chaetodon trifascialis]|uniref:cardiac-enriched FHL2-interacting protein n=1 Tax=Chaetodon trifascialis TaxID=109706 RepID=UPI003996C075
MTSVEKRRSGRKSGGHRKHSDGGYSDTSSGGSFLDETDREVSNLTDRAFRSLCIGDEAVYNDSDLCSSSPCTQRDRQLAFGQSGQDRDREDREREELKRAAHESFSLRVQQYGQDWIHGGMYGAEIHRDPHWEVYGERTQGRVSATFQNSFVETSQQEESMREEQLSFLSNGATELSSQQRRSRSRVSSLIRAFNSEGHRDGAGMDGKVREWNDETSWDKSALMSIQRELSEFSTPYQQNFDSSHFSSAGLFSSQDTNFYSSEVAAVAHMNSASSFMRSSHSKHSMSAQVNCNSNFFIHSEFSPFKVWRDHNRFPFQQGQVSGFMHCSEFPKWYETPMYKELSLEAQPQAPYRFQERGIRHPRNNLAPVVPPTPSRSTSTSTMMQKTLAVEKRCESELAGHYPHRKRAQSLGTNRFPSQRPSTASPTIEMSRRVQDTISSVKALQQKIKMMAEQNITTEMTANQQGVLYSNDYFIPFGNNAKAVASNVVSSNTSTTPFNISQLLTPLVHTHQEAETSEVQQYADSPQPVEHPPVRAESRGATPDVRMSSYKSRATSLLFNLKDNRKRVKSTYSPTKFKGLETMEKNKQSYTQEPRDTVIDIPDFPDSDLQFPQRRIKIEEEERIKENKGRRRKQLEEERAAQEEQQRRAAQEEWQRKAAQEEQQRKAAQEEQQRRAAQEEEQQRRAVQEEQKRRAAQEEQQRRAAQEEQKKRAAQEEEKKRAAQEEQKKRAAQEEQQRRAAQEEQKKRAAQEEQKRRAAQEEQQRKAAQEEQKRRAAQEEQQRKAAQQEEQQRRAVQEEQKKRAAQEEQQRRAAQEEQKKRTAQEEQQRRAVQEEQKRRAAQEEQQRRAAEEEQQRQAAQEEQKKRVAQEEQQRRAAREEEQQMRAAQEEQQRSAALIEEKQRRAVQEEQKRRAALIEEQQRRAAQEEQQRRAALAEEQRRAKQSEENTLDIEEENKRKQREEKAAENSEERNKQTRHQIEKQRSERQTREEWLRTQKEQEERRAVQTEKTLIKQREEKQAKEERTRLLEERQAALKEEQQQQQQQRVAQEQMLAQREDEIRAKMREEEKLAAYKEKERAAQMEEQKRGAQRTDALQYYAITSIESERKHRERQQCSPLPLQQRNNPSGLISTEDSHTRPNRPHAPASPAPSQPRSNTSSPALGVKPSMFRVKDNTIRGSSFTKSVKPRFHKTFGEDFRVGSPMGSERGEEEQETMRRSAVTPVHLAAIKESSTFHPASSSQDFSSPLPHYRPYSRRSIALDEDDSRSIISNMSEDVESFATSAADLADIRGLYDYERPESACSFSSDVSRSLGKPPAVPPKSEKALRRAKRLTTRRIKKELSKTVTDSAALQEVSSIPSSSSTEVRSSNHHAVASPHFSPPVSLTHAPPSGSSLPSSYTEQSSHSYASPHATGPISLPVASPHATTPVSLPVASPHAAGPASHHANLKTVADVPSSPTLHHANHPAPVTQYHVESSYPQSYPLTQRKVLQDLGSGQYFVVDVPVQVKTKTFFDPETGKYVQLNVRESAKSTSRPQSQQTYLQPQLQPQTHMKPQQQPLPKDAPAGKPHVPYQGHHGYPQGYQPAAINSVPHNRSSAPVTLQQDQQPVRESHSYGYPAPEMGQNSEGHRYSPEKTPYMDTVNDKDKTYNTVCNTHGPYESFPEGDTNSQLAGSSVCENDNAVYPQYQPRDIITMSELEDFMELSDW